MNKTCQRTLVIIFCLSGFSGLIYESIWSHYLKLFLGHAAYAQSLVLITFMGGMAIGAWISQSISEKRRINLLLAYAAVELVIGLLALIFHKVFISVIGFSYEYVIPHIGSPMIIHASKWLVSALLILPQAILLGATFPLMSTGIMRRFHGSHGKSIATLYFANSVGACIGVLMSGFYLVKTVGLSGTIMTAGMINIALACAVWILVKKTPTHHDIESVTLTNRGTGYTNDLLVRVMLGVALLTGTASFVYEIVWIRMLSLVLGSSTHSFELMLSAFILGLALGGLYIRNSIDHLKNPLQTLMLIQIIMAVLAASTTLLYNHCFELMSFFYAGLKQNDAGYILFNISSHLIVLLVMLPTTFCAGMTLPLVTNILLNHTKNESPVGKVYALNTVGAIIGVLLTIHLLLPILGLKIALMTGAIIDVCAAIMILRLEPGTSWQHGRYAVIAGLVAIGLATAFSTFNMKYMTSSVFRHGQLLEHSTSIYHRDGKTATIDLIMDTSNPDNNILSILTNGKPDASVSLGSNASRDESTQKLLAWLPLSLHGHASNVAIIGMGSGMTTHAALLYPDVTRVDTIEIESKVVEAARFFEEKSHLALTDPRSHIHIDDAKTFFNTYPDKYDIIISEPSNPWVSGVSSLFSVEFYRQAKNKLNHDGLFAQWLHIYEINDELLGSSIKALSHEFSDYRVYQVSESDILLIAKASGLITGTASQLPHEESIRDDLARIAINVEADIETRLVGNRAFFAPYLYGLATPANSDYFPVLDQGAAKTRFKNDSSTGFVAKNDLFNLLADREISVESGLSNLEYNPPGEKYQTAWLMQERILHGNSTYYFAQDDIRIQHFTSILDRCQLTTDWIGQALFINYKTTAYLTSSEASAIWKKIEAQSCYHSLPKQIKLWVQINHYYAARNYADTLGAFLQLSQHTQTPLAHLLNSPHYVRMLFVTCLKTGRNDLVVKVWKNLPENIQLLPDIHFLMLTAVTGLELAAQ